MQFGPGLAATFLYYFTSAAVAISFVVARSTGLGIETGIPQQFGAVGGLVAGVIGVYFNRTAQVSLSVQGRKKWLNALDSALAQYGYQLTSTEDDLRIYERSGWSKWFSGRIFVQIEAQIGSQPEAQTKTAQITIASRAVTVRALKQILPEASPKPSDPKPSNPSEN